MVRLGGVLGKLTLVLVVASAVGSVMAQTPTPPATPTPTVLTTDSGTFVLEPRISYGEAGVMIALVIVAGLLLMRLAVEVVGWLLR